LPVEFLLAKNFTSWRGIFKELSQDEGWAEFAENLRASLFNEYLSNDNLSSRFISMDKT
jgi:hypothetical protein